jgi:diguanylate cyclase (GGDEF)-like protein
MMKEEKFLEKVGIFSLLNREEIARLSEHLHVTSLDPGQILFHEGDEGDNLYIIADGRMSVCIRLPDGSDHEIAQCGSGDFFGEMSIFDDAPRSATCRALVKSSLRSLSKADFFDIITDHPQIALKLMYRMLNVTTQRLRNTSEFVTDMVLWGENARKRAVTDELTGVYNRRFLDDSLETYAAEVAENGTLSLMMVDLDFFRKINEEHGQERGDRAIRQVAGILKATLRPADIIARYGGDEFVIVLPDTGPEDAMQIARSVCAEVSRREIPQEADIVTQRSTVSIGVAAIHRHATDAKTLCKAADCALYKAKEGGRNRVECANDLMGGSTRESGRHLERREPIMGKTQIESIRKKNLVIENIIDAIISRHHFLLLGHSRPDDDCLASMISFALLLHMFYKDVLIYSGGHLPDRFRYLLDICRYNSIRILDADSPINTKIDTVIVFDTPKPSMIESPAWGLDWMKAPGVCRIEIDHHLGADSDYFGDDGFRFVTEASSASELIGHILLKLVHRKELLESYQIADLFPRNLVLTILTGIIGDSNRGQYLKSKREKRYYDIFSTMFNDLLSRSTVKKTNFFTMDEVYSELQKLSSSEESCLQFMMGVKRFSPSVGYVALSEESSMTMHESFDGDTVVSTARIVADRLAEESARLSLVAYFDDAKKSDLIQFRVRRAGGYKKFDLRTLLTLFSIENGGGHEGAIGFRLSRNTVPDFPAYVEGLIAQIEQTIPR